MAWRLGTQLTRGFVGPNASIPEHMITTPPAHHLSSAIHLPWSLRWPLEVTRWNLRQLEWESAQLAVCARRRRARPGTLGSTRLFELGEMHAVPPPHAARAHVQPLRPMKRSSDRRDLTYIYVGEEIKDGMCRARVHGHEQ